MKTRRIGWTAALALLVTGTAAALPAVSGDAVSSAYAPNRMLASFTFTIHGTMAMHTFPWLHFPIDGRGTYERGKRFDVELSHLPFFAHAFGRVDLSALAPSVWRNKYVVSFAGAHGSDDVYALHDPSDQSLRVALVRVNPVHGIREVRLEYQNGGVVDLHVNCVADDGYIVPATSDGQIDVPNAKLSVNATFSQYALVSGRSLVGDAHTR